jgi:hypothetical protein
LTSTLATRRIAARVEDDILLGVDKDGNPERVPEDPCLF